MFFPCLAHKFLSLLLAVISFIVLFGRYWDKDRYMAADIEAAIKIVTEGKVMCLESPIRFHYVKPSL